MKLSGHDVDVGEASAIVTLDARVADRVVLQGAVGAVVAGRLEVEGTTHDVLPGWIGAVAVAVRVFDGAGAAPFVLGNISMPRASSAGRCSGRSAERR